MGLMLCGLAATALAACSARAVSGEPAAGVLKVLAAETFLADIAQNVAGDRLVIESLLPPGVDPHAFQPTPQDAIKIAQAQVLIINGLGYEAWLEKSLEASGGEAVIVEASAGLETASEGDPHLWMSPRNTMRYVENIREALVEADPAGASYYAENAEGYIAKLQDLDAWIEAEVATIPEERRVLITNHHALESFADAYGFEIAGVVVPGFTSEAAPSAQQLGELIRAIESREAPAIFLDVSENPDLARQIASESGAQVVTGLYVETLSEAGGLAGTYIDMLKHDVSLIVEALK
jgi:ABC-type Zn uptake system ZnuABC Zn-binding protein ZnuA